MSVTLDDVNSILDAVERGVKRSVVVDFFTSGGAKPPDHVRVVQQTVTVQAVQPVPPPTTPIIPSVQAHPKPPAQSPTAPTPIINPSVQAHPKPTLSREQEQEAIAQMERATIAKMMGTHKMESTKMATDHNRQRMATMRRIVKQWTYDSIAKNISITTNHRGQSQEGCSRVDGTPGVALSGEALRGPITASTLRTWLHKGECPQEHEHAIVMFLERYSGMPSWGSGSHTFLKLSPAGDRYSRD